MNIEFDEITGKIYDKDNQYHNKVYFSCQCVMFGWIDLDEICTDQIRSDWLEDT